MADRVHPRDSPPVTGELPTTSSNNSGEFPLKPSHPLHEDPVPPPGTYVIQVPKDQIYRYPPPENARRYQHYSNQKPRRSSCCRCFCYSTAALLLLLFLLAAAAGILFLVFRPESPKFSVESISIRNLNLTSSSPSSPAFDVTFRAENPNDKLWIYYEQPSSVNVRYSDVILSNGVMPAFHQKSNNVTVFLATLSGYHVALSSGVQSAMMADQKKGKVLMQFNIKSPLRIKVGAVKTWRMTVKVKCDITVNQLTAPSKIVSRHCDHSVKPWW